MLFVLSAPSGTGKTTVAERLLKSVPNLRRVVTATTRPKREHEVEGVDYFFMDEEEFKRGIQKGMFLEWALVYGSYYGTPIEQVIKNEEEGYDSLLVIDVQGARQVKQKHKDSVLIFLLPPSLEELKRRLLTRGYVDQNLEERLMSAEREIACAVEFDYIVVNEFVDKAVEALTHIILSQRFRKENFFKRLELRDERIREVLKKAHCNI